MSNPVSKSGARAASKSRRAAAIVLLAAGLLGAWTIVLQVLPQRAVLAESNYQANLIRLQDYLFGVPRPVVLVGSSITGRLLAEYFEGTPLARASNLGLDGSGPLFGLQLLGRASNSPPLVLVEANLVGIPPGTNDVELLQATDSFTFRLAGWLPVLRSENRPSSLLYSWFKRRRDERTAGNSGSGPSANAPNRAIVSFERSTPAEKLRHRERVAAAIRRLEERGSTVVLVRFPHAGVEDDPASREPDPADALARDLNLRQIELGLEMRRRGEAPSYTDGTHLTASSARAAARVLAEVAVAR